MPAVRELIRSLDYPSPRSAVLLMEELEANGFLEHKKIARTVSVPLVETATYGMPILAEQNIEAMIPVTTALAKRVQNIF